MKKLTAVFILAFFCCKLFAQSNIPSYVPTNGLVGWWPFNGNANDESGNGNNGTVNGASLTSDRNNVDNKAFNFNPNQLSFIKTNALATSIYDNFSTSVWVSSNKSIVLPNEGSQSNSSNQCVIHPTHGSCFGDYNSNSGSGLYVGTNGIVVSEHSHGYIIAALVYSGNINGWHSITVVYVNKQPQLYIDGLFVKSGIANSRNVHPSLGYDNTSFGDYSHSGFGVGFNNTQNTSPQFFDGKIDDIAIYNRALSQQEITALYTGQTSNNTNTDTTTNNVKPVPPGIPYQAVIRNASGKIMTNANVTAQFTLHKDSAIGGVEYQEVHALTTNGHGLINTILGKGTATQGTFAGINWANTNKFLQVQMDLGNGYVDLGTQQLMSVPYAMYAANGPKGEKGDKGEKGETGNGFKNGTSNGQIMYWKDSVWVTVSPGTDGQTLTLCNGLPHWGPCPVDPLIIPSVTIGSQIWSSKNLNVTTYRNGDPIPQVTDPTQWANLTTGAWCWYNNDSANYSQYGKLYNWYAVNDPRGLAPQGWHVPSDGEWNTMTKFLDESVDTTCQCWSGSTIGTQLKNLTGWNTGGNFIINSGFADLPGGYCNSIGNFYGIGNDGVLWNSSESNTTDAWYRHLYYNYSSVYRNNHNKRFGFSVRLVRD